MKAEAQAGVLTGILREAERRAAAARSERGRLEREAARARAAPDFAAALGPGRGVAVIGEIKRRSPSAGRLAGAAANDAAALARRLADAGAAALSVLTEPGHFDGSLEDLARVAAAVGIPVLRKDFLLDAAQLFEARAAGASAVLLIARVLPGERLVELARVAQDLGLACLVEVHAEAELPPAVAARPAAIGVNARDLDTLALDAALVERLIGQVPGDLLAVAESGLATRGDVERVAGCGADAVLVGTAVSGAADPAAALRPLLGVERRGRGERSR
ncbi:MAG TPA: indole-3-glycerol-phosphate synthase [Gemmatimonadales bacterium]|nr:indole-3-glycerol-phosphate synthase [Gemmatimonadales bacterium]